MARSAFVWPTLLCWALAGWLAGAVALSATRAAAAPWNETADIDVHHGVMLARQGDWQGALADFDAALAADPSLAAAHVDRGFVLLRRGDTRTALDEADAALRLAPTDALAHNLRGRAEEQLGDFAAAHNEFRQALTLAPYNAAIARNFRRLSLRVPSREGGDAGPDAAWRAPPPGARFPTTEVPEPRLAEPRIAAPPAPPPQAPTPQAPTPLSQAPQYSAPPTAPQLPAPGGPPPQVARTAPVTPPPPPSATDSWPTQPAAPLPLPMLARPPPPVPAQPSPPVPAQPSPPVLAQPSLPSPPPYVPPPQLREPPPQNLALNIPPRRGPAPGPVPEAPSSPPSAEPALLDHPQSLPPAPGVALRAGSGVVLDDGTWIVTNHHVIAGARSVAVRNGGGYVRRATITSISSTDDLALLHLERPFPATAGVPLSALIAPVAGRQVIVMGYPVVDVFGSRRPNLTPGLVARTDGLRDDPSTFQLTAAIRPGNSGSPVFDLQGHLLGIISELLLQQGRIPAVADEGGAAMSIAIKASRVLALMHRGAMTVSRSVDAPMLPETLYQKELTSVVLVVAYP